jgi:hypothetical protein
MKMVKVSLTVCCLFVCSAFAETLTSTPPVKPEITKLGCGFIVSLRESTQKPVGGRTPTPRTSGGVVGQILSGVPGVGIAGAVVGDLIGGAVISTVSSNLQDADKAKQIQAELFENVQAVEFQFDDGEVINLPLYVVSGMRYKTGVRLRAYSSTRFGTVSLTENSLFGAPPSVGESDYEIKCRIDNPESRKLALASAKNLIDESRIVNVNERRMNSSPATPVVVEAVQK